MLNSDIKPIRRILLSVPLLIMMIVIFLMSAQVGKSSSSLSDGLTRSIVVAIYDDFEARPVAAQLDLIDTVGYFIRKFAHFGEYTLLGMSAWLFIRTNFKLSNILECVFAFAFGVLYAASDEVHQLFVPDRSCSLFDVLIDSSGVFLGIAIISAISALISRHHNRKKTKSAN